jgi:hypothetical protein
MAVTSGRNIRLGRVLPGTRVGTRIAQDGGDAGYGFGSGAGDIGLRDEDTGGSATSAASLFRAQTERAKFLSDLQAEQAKQARAQQGAALQAQFLQSQLGAGIPTEITGEITAQETAGQKYIEDQAKALLDLLTGRRTQAEERVGAGYGALATYLQQNAPQAFAQAQRAVPQAAQSALSQYITGQGVSPAVAQEAANIANVQAAGGAANFNQLLDVLAAREAAAQQSRLAEAEMGRTSALTGLESLYGAGTAQLEQQRLAALADLATRISNARLQAQQAATTRQQEIQNALTTLLGTGNLTQEQINAITGTTPTTTATTTAPAKPSPVEQLAAKTVNIKNQALVNRIEDFAAANPNATPAQIRKQFPSLGKNITR